MIKLLSACALLVFRVQVVGAESFPECRPGEQSQTVTFLHVTDLHAHYYPYEGNFSRYARIVGYFDALKSSNPYTLLMDGGDQYEKGSFTEHLSKGLTTLEVSRHMPFDVRTLGNHDFAWDINQSLEYSRQPSALVLSSNLTWLGKDPGLWGAKEYGELQIGCLKIGFFGLVGAPWNSDDEPFAGRYYPEVEGRYDYVQRAQEIVSKHRKSVHLLVMLSHLGLEWDSLVAASVPGIDLVLGGHTHDVVWKTKKIGDSRITNAGFNAGYLGKAEMTYDLKLSTVTDFRYELISMTRALPASNTVQMAIDRILEPYLPYLKEPVARLRSPVNKEGIARLTAKAAADVFQAGAVLVDKKTVWREWRHPDLTLQDLFDAFPVEREPPGTPGFNSFYLSIVRGKDLLRIREGMDTALYVFYGPAQIQGDMFYKLALPKRVALNAKRWMPAKTLIGAPESALEAWQVLREYARKRSEACLYFDVEEKIGDCRRP